MYHISDEQVSYILDDIRRNGIETEDLQLNLLDHICCIIERELKGDGDFERFYHETARRFYKRHMRELEEETINLLTFKNYYAMKKVMIASGALSTAAFVTGSVFKAAHWPGAGVLLALGITSFSLLFLPLLFILKAREATSARDKIVAGLACIVGAVFSLATLFTVMHWPGSSVMWFSAIGITAFVLLPVYFFTGIRRPETRLNTILMSIVLVGVTGLQFTLMNTRPGQSQSHMRVEAWMQDEVLLKRLVTAAASADATLIFAACEQLKTMALENAAANPAVMLREGRPSDEFMKGGRALQLIAGLREAITKYNAARGSELLPMSNPLLSTELNSLGLLYSNVSLLTSITQLQLYLVTAESGKLASAAGHR